MCIIIINVINIIDVTIIMIITNILIIIIFAVLITSRPLMLTIGKMFSSDTVVNISTAKSSLLYLMIKMMEK